MLNQRLRETRKEAKYTQKQMAEKIGISTPGYGDWERGTKIPNLERLQKISEILNVSTDYLLGNTDEKNSKEVEDDLEKSLDTFKSFDGKPMSDHDRDVIRELLRDMFDDED